MLDINALTIVRYVSLKQIFSQLLERVHQKIRLIKSVSGIVFRGVKILLSGYFCLLFKLRRIGHK